MPEPPSISSRAGFPIIAIGASAGGLDACRKLLDALPAVNGMAFIIVQHLDPSHESMMVDLLAGHTSMPVLLADRRHENRTRARLCHSSWRLSLGR
jgi:chemotaxis response regulator CheB